MGKIPVSSNLCKGTFQHYMLQEVCFFFLKHNAMNYYILLNDRSLTFLSRKNIKDSKHMHLHIWRYSILHAKFCSTLLFYQIYYENRSDCSICREKKIVSCYRQNFLSCLKSSCRATIQVSSYGELPQDATDPALKSSVPEGNAIPQLPPAQRATQPLACHSPTHSGFSHSQGLRPQWEPGEQQACEVCTKEQKHSESLGTMKYLLYRNTYGNTWKVFHINK